jgi:hypothetical protein
LAEGIRCRDPDFDFIRGDPKFKALVGATDQA